MTIQVKRVIINNIKFKGKKMEKKLTHEIAFFNLLRNLIPAKFKYNEYAFSINDIEGKLEMNKSIIRGLLKNLESDKLI